MRREDYSTIRGSLLKGWCAFPASLLKVKSNKLGPRYRTRVTSVSSNGVEPPEKEVATALMSLENAEAVEPDELLVQLLIIVGLRHESTAHRELHHQVITLVVWIERSSAAAAARCRDRNYEQDTTQEIKWE